MKNILLLYCLIICIFDSLSQNNLIVNPGFEADPSGFTVSVGSPSLNNLMKVVNYNSVLTETTQPVAPAVAVTDGLWVKKQSVSSSVISAYLASGGANSGSSYLFMKVGGGSSTSGIDWTKFSVQQRVALSNAAKYTFSFFAKVGTGVTSAYAYIADKNGNTGGSSFYKAVALTGGANWTKYTVSFDIPSIRVMNNLLDFSTAYVGLGVTPGYTTANPPLTVNTWLYVDDFELLQTSESVFPVITSATLPDVYIKTNPIPVKITFNGPVSDFSVSDLIVANATVANFVAVSPSTYTVDLIPTATGRVTLDIASGAAVDNSSNPTAAANQFVRFYNNEITTGNYSLFTSVCPVKDNKKAIYCFTADDGFTDAATFFNNEFKRLNLCGSLALVANWINGAQTPASTYSFWNTLLADERFDIINHSKSHVKFTTISNLQTGKDSLYNEIVGNQAVLRSKLVGQQILTMANPAVVNTDAADALIKQSHYAARNGSSGYNSLSPSDTEWFKLNMLSNYFSSKSRAAYSTEINKYVDNAITNKQWLIILAHGIGTAVNAMTDTAFTQHFEYVATKKNDLWVAKIGDVVRYIREKQNVAVITVDSSAANISLSVTHSLDAQIFNYPLTLKTRVPDNWTTVTVTQNLTSVDVSSTLENGLRYIYYTAIPNGGNIQLTPSGVLKTEVIAADAKPKVVFRSETSSLVLKNPSCLNTTVTLTDVTGKEVCRRNSLLAHDMVNLSGLNPGVYIVSCSADKVTQYSIRIVKKK